jgi:hypothetical protein
MNFENYKKKYLKYKKKYLSLKQIQSGGLITFKLTSDNVYNIIHFLKINYTNKIVPLINLNTINEPSDFIDIINNNYNNLKPISLGNGLYYFSEYLDLMKSLFNKNGINTDVESQSIQGITNFNFWNEFKYFRSSEPIRRQLQFRLNESIKPSDGLLSLINGPTICDCANSIQICIYVYILNKCGKEMFDNIFQKILTPFMITQLLYNKLDYKKEKENVNNILGNPLLFLFDDITDDIQKYGVEALQNNDIVYIDGVTNYQKKHLEGNMSGFNMFYKNKKFNGFSRKSTWMTYEQVIELLKTEYNKDVSIYTTVSAKKLKNALDENPKDIFYRETFELYSTLKKDKILSNKRIDGLKNGIRFNNDKLESFINTYKNCWINAPLKDLPSQPSVQYPVHYIFNVAQESMNNSFDNYEIKDNNRDLYEISKKFAHSVILKDEPFFMALCGNPGIGKSHLTVSILKLVSKYKKVVYMTDILSSESYELNSYMHIISKCDLIIYDDINSAYGINKYLPILFEYIWKNKKALLINSNVMLNEMSDHVYELVGYDHEYVNNFIVKNYFDMKSYRNPWINTIFNNMPKEDKINLLLNTNSAAGIILEDTEATITTLNSYKKLINEKSPITIYCAKIAKQDDPPYNVIDFHMVSPATYDLTILYISEKYKADEYYQFFNLLSNTHLHNKKIIIITENLETFFKNIKYFITHEQQKGIYLKMRDRARCIFPGLYDKLGQITLFNAYA